MPRAKQKLLDEIGNPKVAAVFDAYPNHLREKLLHLRRLILETAAETEGVGELEEALRWGQPSYLTTKSKCGSMIRIDRVKNRDDQYAIYVHCQTTLIETFRELYPGVLIYDGKRAILFDVADKIPVDILRHCISLALTYHSQKRRNYL